MHAHTDTLTHSLGGREKHTQTQLYPPSYSSRSLGNPIPGTVEAFASRIHRLHQQRPAAKWQREWKKFCSSISIRFVYCENVIPMVFFSFVLHNKCETMVFSKSTWLAKKKKKWKKSEDPNKMQNQFSNLQNEKKIIWKYRDACAIKHCYSNKTQSINRFYSLFFVHQIRSGDINYDTIHK